MYREVTCYKCKFKIAIRLRAFKKKGLSCCFCKIVLLTPQDIQDTIRLDNLFKGKRRDEKSETDSSPTNIEG